MTIIFDGRAFAEAKIKKLDKEVADLKNRGIHPKLASIIVGEDPASKLYVSLKKKKAEEIGAEMDVYFLRENENPEVVLALIDTLNKDSSFKGIMVQLPLPAKLESSKNEIIGSIDLKKDVDGLREDSIFVHPTALAVTEIIKEAERRLERKLTSIYVFGKDGMVGKALMKELNDFEFADKPEDADVVVSATGSPGLVRKDMIKKEAVVIDVGSPKGDVDFQEVSKKASFVTPVPGGVGPVTIVCLLQNLLKASNTTI